MQTKHLHSWRLSYPEAVKLQKRLAGRVKFTALKTRPRIVAGLDCALSPDKNRIIAAAVVLSLPDLAVLETAHAARKADFPYIPGLLSFREAPACIAVVQKLKNTPNVFLIDGQGIAHPRRLGLAAHLGLFFDTPAIGCAKSRLIGSFDEPSPQKGSFSLLKDCGAIIGAVLRTRNNVKPLFVSVGHKCLLQDAIKITIACTSKYRLPEPTRLAHQLVTRIKNKL
jgi:deoxyribonuclease V